MKKIIFTAAFWLAGCAELPDLGQQFNDQLFESISPDQSRLIIYSDPLLSARNYRIGIDDNPPIYLMANSYQQLVVDPGVHEISLPGIFYGEAVMPLLGLSPARLGGANPNNTGNHFESAPATTHYLRLEIERKRSVAECGEEKDIIRVCPITYSFNVLKEVTEGDALNQISEYREAINE